MHTRAEELNLITVEDPIEYQIPGCNQVQVNEKAGITFATGLRSILRQDPNIIMVGEIRDRDTAEIAFQASLTGHLVFSTLHTNNAVSTVTRLMDIGMEPYLVASCVAGVVAQRLVRRNCPHCREKYTPDARVIQSLGIEAAVKSGLSFYRGAGCNVCDYTGYHGRVGIYEMFPMTRPIKELLYRGGDEGQILTAARKMGMSTMEENGLFLALQKITTPEEILRVMPPEEIGTLRKGDWPKKLLALYAKRAAGKRSASA